MKAHFPAIQFIVSTHSPFICQAADQTIRLPVPGEGRVAEHVSEDVFKRVVHGTADDAVLTELFGLERTWSDETEEMRRDLGVLRAKQARSSMTKAELQTLSILQQTLPPSRSREVAEALEDVKAMWVQPSKKPAE